MKKLSFRVWPVGVILLVWLLFSYPYWGRGRIPFPSTYLVTFFAPWSSTHGMPVKNNAMPDVITQIYPWKRVTIDGWKQGRVPLWNPYSFSGTSHIGSYQTAVFSPVNALFFLFPEVHAWSIMILLQPLLAALGMLLFIRSLGVSRQGATIGSLAFMFCGFITVWMAYGTLGYAVLALPFILYGLHIFLTQGCVWGALLSAGGLGLSFLSGHFQMSVYVLFFAGSFLMYHLWQSHAKRRGMYAVIVLLGGLLLAAPQILPALESYTHALRSTLFTKGEVIPWQYLITIFSPDFFGNPVTRNDWFGHYAEWATFIGVVPLLLSVFALTCAVSRKGWVRFFALTSVASILLAFQSPVVDVLFSLRIPVLSTSAASRIVVLLSFSLAVLSGFGLDLLREAWEKGKIRALRVWLVSMGVFVVALWGVLWILTPLPLEKLSIAIRNTVLPTLLLGASLAVSAAAVWMPKRMRRYAPYILILLVAVDMYRFASKWMPFDHGGFIYPQEPVITKLKALVGNGAPRVFGNIGGEVGSAFGIPLIEGYDAVYQYRYGKLISSATDGRLGQTDRSVVIFNKRGRYSEQLLKLLGVKYYMHKKSDGRLPWAYPFWELPHYKLVWEDPQFEIWENTLSLPRALLASSYVVAIEEQEILDVLYGDGFDPRSTVVLEEKPLLDPSAGEGTARIMTYGPTEVVIETQTSAPKLLFLSDVYDAGWRATVDGKSAPLYRADFDFRAVAVPAGTHTVRMWYAPRSLMWGFALSGFATLGLVVLFWKKRTI